MKRRDFDTLAINYKVENNCSLEQAVKAVAAEKLPEENRVTASDVNAPDCGTYAIIYRLEDTFLGVMYDQDGDHFFTNKDLDKAKKTAIVFVKSWNYFSYNHK